MTEIIDVLTPDGAPAGTTKPKPLVHRDGDWHRAVHVWIVQGDGRVLVQLRARVKENHPGLWDVSSAGHISAGESAIDAAVRETREELGLDIDPSELRHVATLREQSVLNGGTYIDNELHEIFIVRRDVDLSKLRLQPEEVDDARLVTWGEFRMMQRVPHDEEYARIERLTGPFSLLGAMVSIGGAIVLSVSVVALLRYHVVEARVLALIGMTYFAAGVLIFRMTPGREWVPPWVIPAGVLVAVLELGNIWFEQFVGLPSPANAVVPASMMAFLVLAASTAGVVASAGDRLSRGIVSAVVVVGLGMLLSVSAVLVFVAVHSQPLLRLTCENAALHLTLPLVIAAIVGSAASVVAAGQSRFSLRTSALISVAGIVILAAGVRILVVAASLPRSERPPLVLPGMALSALGLLILPSILGRRARA